MIPQQGVLGRHVDRSRAVKKVKSIRVKDANHYVIRLKDGRRAELFMDEVNSVVQCEGQTVIQRQAEAHPHGEEKCLT